MSYTCALSLKKIKDYLAGAAVVGFDFETSPIEEYRSEERAALDAHKAAITGVSLSVSEDSGIYIPLRHRAGRNIQKPEAVMDYLRQAVFENATVIKVAHNLAFESMFLYALGVIVQPPCYDTIAAAQLTLKSSTTFRGLSDSGLKTIVPQLFHVELPDFETVTAGRFFDELDPQDKETVTDHAPMFIDVLDIKAIDSIVFSHDFIGYIILLNHTFLKEATTEVFRRVGSELSTRHFNNPKTALNNEESENFCKTIEFLSRHIKEKNHTFQREILNTGVKLLFYELWDIETRRNGMKPRSTVNIHWDSITSHFMYLVHTHCHEHHDVTWYANKLCITPEKLTGVLKKLYGKTANVLIDETIMAEAKVFLSKDDPTPISNFTSTQMAKDVPGGLYIRAAQDEALNEALDNAGFGIQLCDVIQVSDGSQYGSEIPLAQVEAARQATQQNQTAAVDAATIQTVEAETPAQPAAANNASVQMAAPIVSEMPAAEPLVTEEVAATEPVAAESAEPMADPAPMEQEPVGAQAAVAETVDPAPTADGQTGAVIIELPQPDTNEAPAAPIMETDTFEAAEVVEDAAAPTAYTADMSVEDICERMTLDDARSVVVDIGTCKGWTLEQVAERRAPSLKFYVRGCSDANNILKAAATLLLTDLEQKKAG